MQRRNDTCCAAARRMKRESAGNAGRVEITLVDNQNEIRTTVLGQWNSC